MLWYVCTYIVGAKGKLDNYVYVMKKLEEMDRKAAIGNH